MRATRTIIWWIRNDLRVHDNALLDALPKQTNLLPVYVWDPFFLNDKRASTLRRAWLADALTDLQQRLSQLGSGLTCVQGDTIEQLKEIAVATGADEIWASAEQTWEETQMEEKVRKRVGSLRLFQNRTLFEPTKDLKKKLPYSYSRFRFKIVPTLPPIALPLPAPKSLPPLPGNVSLSAVPKIDRPPEDKRSALRGLQPGETGALARLDKYMTAHATQYHKTRNGMIGTNYSTKMSVYFADGTLSPRLAWERFCDVNQPKAQESLKLELLWREYFHQLAAKEGGRFFAWESFREQEPPEVSGTDADFERWCSGNTGVEFIDAFMKELVTTGFMGNRGRQIVASYLIFDLKIDWRRGAEFFEKHLIDHDPSANSGNWKYISGTGTDVRDTSKPYKKQKQMYDPKGEMARLWVKK